MDTSIGTIYIVIYDFFLVSLGEKSKLVSQWIDTLEKYLYIESQGKTLCAYTVFGMAHSFDNDELYIRWCACAC